MALTELEQVNAFVGLSMRIEGWPSTLADLGYTLERIELKMRIPDPERPGLSIHVNPDLLFVADARNLSLMAELKSGTFQGFRQLDRMVAVTPRDLVRYGRVAVREFPKLDSHVISFMQVINAEFIDQYLPEFERVAHKASLVAMDSVLIESHYGDLADKRADSRFKEGIALSGCRVPTKLIPVLPTTADEYALVESVVDGLKQLWITSARSLEPGNVASLVYRRLWNTLDTEAQQRYLKIVNETLHDMASCEFHDYLRPSPGSSTKWTLLRLPEAAEPRQLTKELQRFSLFAQTYKQRRLNNTPYAHRHPGQPSFEDFEGFIPKDDK
jgi:hypothetical protein